MQHTGKMQQSKLRCYYTNADSLSKKKNELNTLLSSHNPDIVVITELLPKNYYVRPQEDEYQIPGYILYTKPIFITQFIFFKYLSSKIIPYISMKVCHTQFLVVQSGFSVKCNEKWTSNLQWHENKPKLKTPSLTCNRYVSPPLFLPIWT